MSVCFRDITFCGFWRTCARQEGCRIRLTGCVRIGAEAWAPGRADISQFAAAPPCFREMA